MNGFARTALAFAAWLLVCSCGPGSAEAGANTAPVQAGEQMKLVIGKQEFAVTLADTAAARELAGRLPLALKMSELNGNEKFATLDKPLPARPEAVCRIVAGDVMLWGNDCLVLFYQSFDTPYSYTRIGSVADAADLAAAVGTAEVQVAWQGTQP